MQITPLLLLGLFGSSHCAFLSHPARDDGNTTPPPDDGNVTFPDWGNTTFPDNGNTTDTEETFIRRIPDKAFKLVYTLPDGHYAENLAVRANGKVLVTVIGAPEIWQIDPVTSTGELLYTFPGGTQSGNCTLGITEYAPDVFAVVVGDFDIPSVSGVPGSWAIWSLDFGSGAVVVEKITDISQAVFLNGLTSLAPEQNGHFVMVADSYRGMIYRVNMITKQWIYFLNSQTLQPNSTAAIQLGVNGVRIHDNYVYYDNSARSPMFARVPVPGGAIQVIAAAATFPVNPSYYGFDDFAFDTTGNAWMATNPSRSIVKISSRGRQVVKAGGLGNTMLGGCTSLQFGRGLDSNILYVNVNGQGGKLLMVDTTGY